MTLAAIDIGSNAARLLITEVSLNEHDEPVFNKKNLVRVPLRLGFDVSLRLDLCRGIDLDGSLEEAKSQLIDAGVALIDI